MHVNLISMNLATKTYIYTVYASYIHRGIFKQQETVLS